MEVVGVIIVLLFCAWAVSAFLGWISSDDTDTEPEPYDPIAAAREHAESAAAQARADAQRRMDAAVQQEQQRAAEALRRAKQAQQSETGWE
jgi:hypothetical protein